MGKGKKSNGAAAAPASEKKQQQDGGKKKQKPQKAPEQPAPREPEPEPEAVEEKKEPVRPCSTCKKDKTKAEFTGGQWKKKDAERRCKACVEEEEALLAPAAEAMEKKRQEEKEQRKKEEDERRERAKRDEATGDRAKERRFEVAVEKVLKGGASAEDLVKYAENMNVDVSSVSASDAASLQGLLLTAALEAMLKKPASERGTCSAYTSALSLDDLKGLACELDIYDSQLRSEAKRQARPEIDRDLVVSMVRAAAKDQAGRRVCEACNEWKKKADFGQNQWKKAAGSKCKDCMKKEEEERQYFEEYARAYGLPADDEEQVYTSQANLYETIGVEEDVTPDDMKRAYKKLAIKYHPDRWASAAEEERLSSEEKFKLITEAYETLSNPERKKVYDKDLQKKKKKQQKKEARAAQRAAAQEEEA